MPSRPPKSAVGRLLVKRRALLRQPQTPGGIGKTTRQPTGPKPPAPPRVLTPAQLAANTQMLAAAVAAIRQGKAVPGVKGASARPKAQAPAPAKTVQQFTDLETFNRAANHAQPDTVYRFGNYEWETDGQSRVARVEGQIQLKKHGRHTTDGVTTVSIGQSPDAEDGDVGFHLIGDQFDGPINNLNVVPGNGVSLGQLKSLNLSGYKRWENNIAKLARQGQVTVRIEAIYSSGNTTTRPNRFVAAYQDAQGKWVKTLFNNKAGG